MHAPRLISIDQNDIADFDKEAVFLIQPQNPEFPIGQTDGYILAYNEIKS